MGWARLAGFVCERDATRAVIALRAETGAAVAYYVRPRGPDRVELIEVDDAGAERLLLFVADMSVLDAFIIGLFGDDVREDLDLHFLQLDWTTQDLANGFRIDTSSPGYQVLKDADGRPVAAVPDTDLSLLALVPLSHFLGWSVAALKRSFLSEDGAPLLSQGEYARPHGHPSGVKISVQESGRWH